MYLYRDKYFAWTRRRRRIELTVGTPEIWWARREAQRV